MKMKKIRSRFKLQLKGKRRSKSSRKGLKPIKMMTDMLLVLNNMVKNLKMWQQIKHLAKVDAEVEEVAEAIIKAVDVEKDIEEGEKIIVDVEKEEVKAEVKVEVKEEAKAEESTELVAKVEEVEVGKDLEAEEMERIEVGVEEVDLTETMKKVEEEEVCQEKVKKAENISLEEEVAQEMEKKAENIGLGEEDTQEKEKREENIDLEVEVEEEGEEALMKTKEDTIKGKLLLLKKIEMLAKKNITELKSTRDTKAQEMNIILMIESLEQEEVEVLQKEVMEDSILEKKAMNLIQEHKKVSKKLKTKKLLQKLKRN
mmetsp:Transcript_45243/g.33016  ORF Transcript_45243/g.33016 Transcript_45243/m.33016 type:complete len:314 (-) Transcript_45243:566-1507(-)